MDNNKWDRVLLDWINCLKLCRPIQKLEDLRDGIFFTNLQKLLRKTAEIDTDVLTYLFHVLSQHYPDFVIKDKANIHLTDLSSTDLSAVTSLLLHYTCIYDRKDVLTSPLCYNLQQITQMCIKNFLEKIQVCPKISNEELANIIQCCVDEVEKKPNTICQLLAVSNSPSNKRSPLQDILQTPPSKNVKLIEKEKKLNKLKTELELVQDEKESLEEDLKLQIEKNTRLEKQLNQKTAEILRLRSEVLVLENRTPPHFQDKDSRETQKILRTKIDSLEQILEQCDREIKELMDERDAGKSQVKTLEAQCKVWLEKFIESDSKLQSLTDESMERESKLISISAHCRELETLLEELKSERKNDSFIEESFQCIGSLDITRKHMEPLPSCEDLAHSVIDIQLKDVQKENEKLQSALYEAETSSKLLKENVNKYLQDIEMLKVEKSEFEDALRKSNEKCEEVSSKCGELEEQFKILLEQNMAVTKEKGEVNEKLVGMSKKYEITASELREVLQKHAEICQQLETVQFAKEKISNELGTKLRELEIMISEKQEISNQLQQVTNENVINRKNLENEICKNKKISEDLADVSENLRVTVEEKTRLIHDLKVSQSEKEQLSKNLEQALRDFSEAVSVKNQVTVEKLDISEQLDDVKSKLKEANERICVISEELRSLALERNDLRVELDKVVEDNTKAYENIANLTNDLDKAINERREILEKFEQKSLEIEEVLAETNVLKEALNKASEEKSSLIKMFEKIQSEQYDTKKELEAVSKNLHEMSLEKEKLLENYETLNEKLESITSEKRDLSNKLNDLLMENSNVRDKLKHTNIEMKALTENMEQVYEEKKRLSELLNAITKEKNDLVKNLAKTAEEKDEADKHSAALKLENNMLNENLKKMSRKLDEMDKEKARFFEDLERTRCELIETREKLDATLTEYKDVVLAKEKISEDIEILNTKLEITVSEKEELSHKFDRVFLENSDIRKELHEYKIKMGSTVDRMNEILRDKEQIQCLLEQVTIEKNSLSNSLNETLSKKNKIGEELDKIKTDHETVTNNLQRITKEYEVAVQARDQTSEKLSFVEEILSKTTLEKNELCIEMKRVLEEKARLDEQIQIVTSEKEEVAHCLGKLRQKIEEVIPDKDQMLKDATSEKQELRQSIEMTMRGLERLTAHLKNAVSERNSFEKNNLEITEDLKIKEEKLKEMELEKTHIYEQLAATISDKTDVSNKLEETVKEKCRIYEDLKEIRHKLEGLSTELKTIEREKYELSKKLKAVSEERGIAAEELQKIQIDKDETIKNLSQINQEREEELREVSTKNKDLSEKLEVSTLKNDKLAATIEGLLEEKSKICTELHVLNTDKQGLLEKLANAIKDKNETLNKVDEILKEKNNISEELENIKREKVELEELIEKSKESSEELLQEKLVVSKFLDLNTSQLRKVSQEKEDILEALEMSNKEVEKVLQEKKDVVELMSQEKIHLLEQLTKRSEEKIELAESLQLSKKELESVLKEKDDLSRQISTITNNCRVLETSLEESEIKLKKISWEKDNISEQYERICKEKAVFSVQLDKVSQENVDIKEKLHKTAQEKAELINSLGTIKSVLGKRAEETESFEEIEKLIKEKISTMQSLEIRNKELSAELDEKSKAVQHLEMQIESTLKENVDTKDILDTVDKLSREKIELADSLDLITKELEKLSREKHDLADTYDKTCKELQKVKQNRNEILESQTKMMKETENNILLAHENAVEVKNDLLKRIELIEKEKQNLKKNLEGDLQVIRQAYANVVSTNSKYELENVNLRKKIEDKNKQLADYSQIKEAYEKLLEENNKLMTEVDTVKYKRARDREDFVNLLKKERMEADQRESKKVREVRNDYEGKLEKMKEKMLKLYREEVNKEMAKVKAEHNETTHLQRTINELKSNLFESAQKIHSLETERDMLHVKESKREIERNGSMSHVAASKISRSQPDFNQMAKKAKVSTSMQAGGQKVERRISTLPRQNFTEVEETSTISGRPSINGVPSSIGHNIEMEDEEDDLFNNKYLADLKDGRCTLPLTGRESNVSRFSELAWRNSLVPPHLKSSYPAETQFVSPSHFKEDDIKAGNIEGDDSMCRLLPGEKPRQRKDFGTTSYKKPGPPTPSKNGGRLSLQGNEIQPLGEHNDKTPKKVTPSRIKALFMGRPSNKENSENQCTTPRTRRLSIFRKQR